jgi:hypothetical protein
MDKLGQQPTDHNAVAAALYNNSDHKAPAPASSATAQGDIEAKAQSIYDAGTKPAYVDVFKADDDARAKAAAKAEAERVFGKPDPAKPDEGSRDTKPAAERTPEQIAEAATALATELKLDALDPITPEFARTVTELKLDKAGAEKLIALDTKRSTDYWQRQSDTWAEASRAEFSEADRMGAVAIVHRFGDPELTTLLNGPYGNHPAIVRLLSRVSRAVK